MSVVSGCSGSGSGSGSAGQWLDSWVYFIDWKLSNHQMPLILLKRENGTEQKFKNLDIILSPDDLKVGDHLVKTVGSKIFTINGSPITCLK